MKPGLKKFVDLYGAFRDSLEIGDPALISQARDKLNDQLLIEQKRTGVPIEVIRKFVADKYHAIQLAGKKKVSKKKK